MKNKYLLSTLNLALLAIMSSIYFFIICSIYFLPLISLVINSSDVLFIGDVAHSLNNSGVLFDWRLTQAPYLFPDIFTARILLAFFHISIEQISIYYSYIFAALLLVLIYWNICLSKIQEKALPLFIFALLYSFFYCFGFTPDTIPLYFGLIGHHCGVAVPLLLAVAATQLYCRDENHENSALFLLFISLFLGSISDSIIIIAFSPLAFIFLSLCAFKKEISHQKAWAFLSILILSIVLAKTWSYVNPYPQDKDYIHFILSGFPHNILPAIKAFIADFFHALFHSPFSAILAVLYFLSFGVAINHLLNVWHSKAITNTAITLLSIFVIFSLLFVIGFQLSLGIYSVIDHSRQWAIIIPITIAFGAMIYSEQYPNKLILVKACLMIFSLIYLIILTIELKSHNKIHDEGQNFFKPLIQCMRKNHLPAGNYYIADYWVSRPVRLYSNNQFIVSPYGTNQTPYTAASNITRARAAFPKFVITGYGINYNDYIALFGKPTKEYCAMNVAGNNMNILDYSHNQKALDYLRKAAVGSY